MHESWLGLRAQGRELRVEPAPERGHLFRQPARRLFFVNLFLAPAVAGIYFVAIQFGESLWDCLEGRQHGAVAASRRAARSRRD